MCQLSGVNPGAGPNHTWLSELNSALVLRSLPDLRYFLWNRGGMLYHPRMRTRLCPLASGHNSTPQEGPAIGVNQFTLSIPTIVVLLYALMLFWLPIRHMPVASIEAAGIGCTSWHLRPDCRTVHRYSRVTIFGCRPHLVSDSGGCKCSTVVPVRKTGYPIVPRCHMASAFSSEKVALILGGSRTYSPKLC